MGLPHTFGTDPSSIAGQDSNLQPPGYEETSENYTPPLPYLLLIHSCQSLLILLFKICFTFFFSHVLEKFGFCTAFLVFCLSKYCEFLFKVEVNFSAWTVTMFCKCKVSFQKWIRVSVAGKVSFTVQKDYKVRILFDAS